MNPRKTIVQLAERILADEPDPAVEYRLLRNVLRRPANDPELAAARRVLNSSRWVQLLAAEQHEDGGWGRFLSYDDLAKQKITSTEAGVERAVALGLGPEHPILRRAANYIVRILEGGITVPDRAEKNDRWPAGVQMFAGAALVQIQRDLPILTPLWQRWAQIVSWTFSGGGFDAEAEEQAQREIHGVRDGVGYLGLRNRHAVRLLGSRADQLPAKIERSYVRWLWNQPRGLGYIDVPFRPPPRILRGHRISGWLGAMQLLSEFPTWRKLASDSIDWLWRQRNEAGWWDFGPRGSWSPLFPLSESWRKKTSRRNDYSTTVLALLRTYYSSQ